MTEASAQLQPAHAPACGVPQLLELAVKGLQTMFDADRRLFCFRLRLDRGELVREGVSHRYTLIGLLGLHRWEEGNGRSPVDVRATLEPLLNETRWVTNLGDLGLLLWLCALAAPECLERLWADITVKGALDRYREAREGRTMDLAWFLAGLAHQTLLSHRDARNVSELAVQTFELLKHNQGAQGIFGHLAKGASLAGRLRGRIGSFADQVYPIYALSRFSEAFGNEEALEMASACAEAICRVQGPLGQWWWHYDSTTGEVVGNYPVYSVHQDGMAPMALFALSDVGGLNFSTCVDRGLQWIAGNNELKTDLREPLTNMIWRSIYRPDAHKYLGMLLRGFGSDSFSKSQESLHIRFECRPYHFGWLLYAFADR